MAVEQVFVSTDKAAECLGITTRSVNHWVARLNLTRYRNTAEPGRRRYLRAQDVERIARLQRNGEFVPESRNDRYNAD